MTISGHLAAIQSWNLGWTGVWDLNKRDTHFKMFHQYSHDDVDKNELSGQNKDDEVDGCYDGVHTAVPDTLLAGITVLPQSILWKQRI